MLGGKGKVETEGGRLRGKEELRKGHGREVEGEGKKKVGYLGKGKVENLWRVGK